MSKQNDMQKLLLSEIQSIQQEIKEVRQVDIPTIKEAFATMKERVSTTSKVYAAIGGGIAVLISIVLNWIR